MSERRKPIQNFLGWVDMHGDEVNPGGGVFAAQQDDPIAGFEIHRANPRAAGRNKRKIDVDLTFALRDPERYKGTHEGDRAVEIHELSKGRDLIVDWHGRFPESEGDVAVVGPEVYLHVLGFVALVGIKTVIVGKNGLHGCRPDTVVMDIHPDSVLRGPWIEGTDFWRSKIRETLDNGLSYPDLSGFRFFTLINIPRDERHEAGVLAGDDLRAFTLPNVEGPVYALHPFGPKSEWVEALSPIDPTNIAVESDVVRFSHPNLATPISASDA